MTVATAPRPQGETIPPQRSGGPEASPVLICNSLLFGAVSLSPAWVNEGAFVFGAHQPPAREVPVGGGWFREVGWGAAVAVSLPDGVHLFDATEVQVALHASGAELEFGMSAEVLIGLLLEGLARLGVAQVREIAQEWSGVCSASARGHLADTQWRKQVRRVWGSRRRMDRASLLKCDLLTAVMGRA
ncbi:hypothetical protein AB0878_47550 [Amycolatopsis sp. NPDC047767]|uniref:hypothetical protein n=1 Tax=Amycolatopsis sp. NPDC047767 TaxID=3156765 RepID=UPI003453177E